MKFDSIDYYYIDEKMYNKIFSILEKNKNQ